jgi:hypothetical protein
MDDAPTPHRAASAEERERRQPTDAEIQNEIAAWLLGRDEASAADEIDHYARHFAGCLPRWINDHHSGDCTKESHSCVRCIAERTYADTNDLIAKHLATLLDRITAAEARAEEAERERDDARCVGEALARAADANLEAAETVTADRDRLADEVALLATPRPLADWHEDHGFVLWWILPVCEPPYSGSPLCDDWPEYHTHWTPLPEIRDAPWREAQEAEWRAARALTATGGTTDDQA